MQDDYALARHIQAEEDDMERGTSPSTSTNPSSSSDDAAVRVPECETNTARATDSQDVDHERDQASAAAEENTGDVAGLRAREQAERDAGSLNTCSICLESLSAL